MIAGVAIGLRLSIGPISLGFLSPLIESAFEGNTAGLKVSVGDTILTWSGADNDVALQVVGIEARGQDGTLIARLPSAGIDLSLRALLVGQLAPTGVTLAGADVTIRRNADGLVELGLGGAVAVGDEVAAGGASPVADLLALLRRGPGNSPALRRLERLSLVRSRLVVEDEMTLRRWVGNGVGGELMRKAGGEVLLDFRLAVASEGEQVSLRLMGAIPPGADGEAALSVEFSNLVPALFDAGGQMFGPAAGIVMPLSGKVSAAVDANGELHGVDFDVTAAGGGLDLPDFFPEGLSLDQIHAAGRYDNASATLHLAQVRIRRGDVDISASGSVGFTLAGPAIDLTARLGGLPVDDLAALWPVRLSVNGRRWVTQNIRGGQVSDGVLRLKAPPGGLDASPSPPDMFSADFAIDGAATTFMAGLPPVSDIKAKAHMTADGIDVEINSGRVDMGPAGLVTLTEGLAKITDFSKEDQQGDISFSATGPVRAALTMLDLPPLGYAGKIGVDPSKTAGDHETRARFLLPLVADLDLDNLDFKTSSKIVGLVLPAIAGPLDLTDGAITVDVDQSRATARGTARLGGAPLDLEWSENFRAPAGKPTTVLTARGTLDDALREKLGLGLGGRITGPIGASVTLEGRGQAIGAIRAELALDGAAITLPETGYGKKAGEPAAVAFRLATGGGRLKFEGLTARAKGLSADGSAEFTTDGDLISLVLSNAQLGKSAFTIDFRRPAPGQRYALKLRGANLDLVPYMDQDAPARRPEAERPDPSSPDGLPDFDFDIDLDRVQMDEKTAVAGLKATGSHEQGRWQAINSKGALGPSRAPLSLKLTPVAGGRRLDISAGDAGAVVRVARLYSDVEGGSLTFHGTIDDTKPNRPLTGALDMRDFKLVKAPVLARILTLGSLTGIAEAIGGEGISLEALKADIVQESAVIRIVKARAYGNSIGMTLSGTYDTWGRSVSVGGTIVPSYGLNRILNSIPLVGDILTGGEGGGLFAFNYSVVGPTENPEVTVNALSALAPGILRDIISAVDGTDSAADAKAPPVIGVPPK
ncbi:MAG: DUF3971 domain-containing protein [Zavarzinia sp.]|nr:DUF3971 domain-containing protein [Zavarzinia sp.]